MFIEVEPNSKQWGDDTRMTGSLAANRALGPNSALVLRLRVVTVPWISSSQGGREQETRGKLVSRLVNARTNAFSRTSGGAPSCSSSVYCLPLGIFTRAFSVVPRIQPAVSWISFDFPFTSFCFYSFCIRSDSSYLLPVRLNFSQTVTSFVSHVLSFLFPLNIDPFYLQFLFLNIFIFRFPSPFRWRIFVSFQVWFFWSAFEKLSKCGRTRTRACEMRSARDDEWSNRSNSWKISVGGHLRGRLPSNLRGSSWVTGSSVCHPLYA